jgi:hypothetical protein
MIYRGLLFCIKKQMPAGLHADWLEILVGMKGIEPL